MIRSVLAATLVAGALFALPAAADCTYPRAPASLPDGNTASMEEMVEGQKAVKAYMADMDAYLVCIANEVPKAPADAAAEAEEQKKERARLETIRSQKHNAAVGEMEAVAERFNVQLRAFRAKQGKK